MTTDDDFCALVIQYDANHALMKPVHWLCFRKDKEGVWWNMDSMLEAPLRITTREVLEKVQYYCNAFNAKLFSALFVKCSVQCLAPPSPAHSRQASMQTVTSTSSPTAAKTIVKKRKRVVLCHHVPTTLLLFRMVVNGC